MHRDAANLTGSNRSLQPVKCPHVWARGIGIVPLFRHSGTLLATEHFVNYLVDCCIAGRPAVFCSLKPGILIRDVPSQRCKDR